MHSYVAGPTVNECAMHAKLKLIYAVCTGYSGTTVRAPETRPPPTTERSESSAFLLRSVASQAARAYNLTGKREKTHACGLSKPAALRQDAGESSRDILDFGKKYRFFDFSHSNQYKYSRTK